MKTDPSHQIIDFIEEDSPLYIAPHKTRLDALSMTQIWHEPIEIKLFYSAGDELLIGNKAFISEKNDIFVINSCEPHSAKATADTDYHLIIIDPAKLRAFTTGKASEALNAVCKGHTVFNTRIRNNGHLKELLEELTENFIRSNNCSDLRSLGLLFLILEELITNEENRNTAKNSTQSTLNLAKKLSPAIRIISNEYNRRITIGELAAACGFDPKYFCKVFNRLTGTTAISYINELRINKAEVLLATTDMQMTEISERCGFSDISYFSRKFKEIKGYAPTKLKKSLQSKL